MRILVSVKDRFRAWAEHHIVVPRWVLSLKYALFVAIGVAAAWNGTATISQLTSDSYVTYWALGIALAASFSFVGSLRVRWESLERWSSLALVSFLSVYGVAALWLSFVEGDSDRVAFSFVLITVTLFPALRAVQLLTKTGLPRG